MNLPNRRFLKVFLASLALVAVTATSGLSASIWVRWDANDPAPEGYRIYHRKGVQPYDYSSSFWDGTSTTCELTGLEEGVTHHFVVRAYVDDLESADSDEVDYTPPKPPNLAPVADAGGPQSVEEGKQVTLDGSRSKDIDGQIKKFVWEQTGGPAVSIDGTDAAKAAFTAPIVGLDGQTFSFRLSVTDDGGTVATATTTVRVNKSSKTDVDGDNVPDVLDPFPDDSSEWADSDGDGIGNNGDPDDDDDGMPDAWEAAHGLDPTVDDSALDADGDGFSNLEEFTANSDPTQHPDNLAPDAPAIESIDPIERVGLTPLLVSGAYFDPDADGHLKSTWQISTERTFDNIILARTSSRQLTTYQVGDMVLDVDTKYYWRVRHIDSRQAASGWSDTASFRTIEAADSDDEDLNGTPESQQVDPLVDVDANGVVDVDEDNMLCVNTVEGQAVVGVKVHSKKVALVSVKSLPTDQIADQSVKLGFGLIGFKLYLQDGVSTASVAIHFSKQVPDDAGLFKYTHDTGWYRYENAVFAPDRKSVTLTLVDGGDGDEDGVENGVIVDPSGIAYAASTPVDDVPVSADQQPSDNNAALSTGAASGAVDGGGGDCFIRIGSGDGSGLAWIFSRAWLMSVLMLLSGVILAAVVTVKPSRRGVSLPKC